MQTGVEHQAVDRLCCLQEIVCAALDAGQIAQVADRRCQLAPRSLAPRSSVPQGALRALGKHLVQASGGGGIAAEHGEAMASLQEALHRLKTDA